MAVTGSRSSYLSVVQNILDLSNLNSHQETVDLPTKSKNPADSPVVIIASTPRIAIKTTAVDTEKRLTV